MYTYIHTNQTIFTLLLEWEYPSEAFSLAPAFAVYIGTYETWSGVWKSMSCLSDSNSALRSSPTDKACLCENRLTS